MNKISNADFIKSVAKKTGFRQQDIKEVLSAIQTEVETNLVNDNATKLFRWLSIEPTHKKACVRRNPATGGTIEVPARNGVKAKFSNSIKMLINE